VTEQPTATAPRSPIQNLLDEVDMLVVGIPVADAAGEVTFHPFVPDDEVKNHIKDQIRSAYATGKVHA